MGTQPPAPSKSPPLSQEIPDIFIPPTQNDNAGVLRGRNENSGMTTVMTTGDDSGRFLSPAVCPLSSVHRATYPPSTESAAPVTWRSLARNNIVRATSLAVATRPCGISPSFRTRTAASPAPSECPE